MMARSMIVELLGDHLYDQQRYVFWYTKFLRSLPCEYFFIIEDWKLKGPKIRIMKVSVFVQVRLTSFFCILSLSIVIPTFLLVQIINNCNFCCFHNYLRSFCKIGIRTFLYICSYFYLGFIIFLLFPPLKLTL